MKKRSKRSKRLKKTCSATNNNNLFTRETAFPTVIHRPQLRTLTGTRADFSWVVPKLSNLKLAYSVNLSSLDRENNYGTIHKRRRQFFRIFDNPLLHVGSFLVLSVGNFNQF